LLITFSGLDGAGKSTLIEWLRASLERDGRPVTVFHMNDHIGLYAYARFVRDRLLRLGRTTDAVDAASMCVHPSTRGAAPGFIRRVRNAILWNKPLRRFIYPIDLAVFACYRFYHEKLHRRVLIMDRYFYDTLVDVSDGKSWFWIRLLERITPTPEVSVYLDVTPEESFERKGEYDVEYLRRRWVAYRTVFPWIPSSVTVRNDDLEATKAVLQRAVKQRLPRNDGASGAGADTVRSV
jgi:hypothetical protein